MEGLRLRLSGLFLRLCELPAFNPGAAAAGAARGGGGGGGCKGARVAANGGEAFVFAEVERAAARPAPAAPGAGLGRAW
jgi:hypothetical protein